MKKTQRSKRRPDSAYADFIAKIKCYQWETWKENDLAVRLKECVQDEERTAEAYSILKEVIKRKAGLSLFDAQLMAAFAMQQGRIAELPTGEGKTLAAAVTAAYLALKKKSIHILVFNDYLAYRDYHDNQPIYAACGLTCGHIAESSDFAHRKAAYACDLVYVSAKEAAFDYLRGFLCTEKEQLLCGKLPVALVDEADSILIDEARVPVVLAGNAETRQGMTKQVSELVAQFSECDYRINRVDNQVWLTEAGAEKVEASMHIENLYSAEHAELLSMVSTALEARFLLLKNQDYIVKDGAVLVVDETTGRVAENRRFPDALHQAVEMRELGTQDASTIIYNSMSMQAFLSLYEGLCGMTGTAATSASELRSMYGLEVDIIKPNSPCIRMDYPDQIFTDRKEQEKAVLSRIKAANEKGQPVLIGTQSVQESEHFSALLTAHGIKHCVLNARNDAEEAGIIENAGKPCQVTISTNMAGRGVDIRLGGKDEIQAELVRAAGGLLVIGTGINRSLRIDNQLRGRAGRQGDPGESQFFVCLEDLMLETFTDIDFYDYQKYPKLLRRAQSIQEGRDAEARYMLERYSQILEAHRRKITDYRTQILLDERQSGIMQKDEPVIYRQLVDKYGARGVSAAEKQLTLYFINTNWAFYLSAMEDKRGGIHLMIIGDKNPITEYQIFAVSAFNEMISDIRSDVIEYMQKCTITEEGIDMKEAGLLAGTTTWTYLINESASQFSRIPHLVKTMSNTLRGAVFTLRGICGSVRKWFIGKRGLN